MSGWFRRVVTETADGYIDLKREIIWEEPHGRGTYGRNRFGDSFWLYDMAPAYTPDKRWRLTAKPLCPDGGRFCSVHDEYPYWGSDYDEAKRVAQQWSNRCWPKSFELIKS